MSNLILKENPRRFTNQEYNQILEFLLELKNTVDRILKTHNGEYPYEEIDGLTKEESMALEYVDSIESINWGTYDKINRGISNNVYFPGTGSTDLFIGVLEELKYTLVHIQTQINCMQAYDFDKMYKEDLETQLKNLNYCLLCSFQMFDVRHGSITVALNEYTKGRGVDPEEFVDNLYNFYKNNRPTLPLFEKYPEVAIALEKSIEPEYFETVVQYSSVLSFKELNQIASGTIIVDDNFIEEMESRFEGVAQ